MELQIHLGPTNAGRHGVPEVLTFDLSDPLLSELRVLRTQTGWDWITWRTLALKRGDPEASAALVWLAVRRHGRDTAWDSFELNMRDVRFVHPDHVVLDEHGRPVDDGLGKAAAIPPGESTNETS